MGSVPVNTRGGGNRAEWYGVVREGQGQGLSEEDESKINEVARGVNVALQPQTGGFQIQQQQPSASLVHWERFLPRRSLKVLLVENDDSTRHVVSALLRNCSYQVVAVSNGLHAWKILQELTNDIDLILTEVVMPCLSGIGLLCKIMNHKTCKNVPVIMMSSHDSMGIVFKCLSKGAVDFLVKPIRKNELKNLWQHVWRRCHSSQSSGSGSESGIQARKSVKSKSMDESDNSTGSNDEDDDGSVGLNVRDGSDNGSGTQSSWTRRTVEGYSPQLLSPWDQLAESTCTQVIHPKSESFSREWVPIGEKKECSHHDEKLLENVAMGKDLEIGVSRNAELQHEYQSENICTNLVGSNKNKMPELGPQAEIEPLDKGPVESDGVTARGKLRAQAAETTCLDTCFLPRVETRFRETPASHSKVPEIIDKPTSDANELPSVERSLKRLRGFGDDGTTAHDDRKILRHSDLSAFSRYNTAYNANQAPTGIVGSCSPLNNNSELVKTDSMYSQHSNENSNNNDMGSTNKNVFSDPVAFPEKSASTSKERSLYPSAFEPLQNTCVCPPLQVTPQKTNANTTVAQPRGAHQQVQLQHHHHYYHHHHHHVHSLQQQQGSSNNGDLSLSMPGNALQCGSSNMVGGPIEDNTGNYSLNGSASGSRHGSNGQNGSSKDLNAGGMNIESDNGVAEKSGVGGSGSGVDQNRSAQRMAALTKFRQKRKERCFERKVRYQSRKRLAEQRPRVRGQFVRQRVYENSKGEEDC
ncbi:hypothetical protein IFM89_028216 [Coptis chinensis]|uniref:Two-component response regulator-like PRR37 n=1 Tax=Coptis chinensis TaxID=261450 RepID=A0A835HFT9_9MAGN|nr:hypothetical protein IFM89_028216 [Coptis chinensis]